MRTISLAILLFSTMACGAAAPGQPAQTRPAATPDAPAVGAGAFAGAGAAGTSGEFAFFGVTFAPPPGWKRVPEGRTGMIARWAKIGPDGKAGAILTLEMEPAGQRNAEQYAAEMAKRAGGTSTASKAAVMSGELTWLVSGSKAGAMTVECLVAMHGKYIYVLAGFADNAEAVPRAEMEALAKSIKFSEPSEPSKHTQMRDEAFPLFNKFTIVPLATMRPNPDPPDAGSVGISTYNFAARRPDFIAEIQLLPNAKKVSMAEIQAQFPGKLGAGKTLTWTKFDGGGAGAAGAAAVGGGVEKSLSSTFEAELGQQKQITRIALVRLGESDIVMIFFSFPNPDPAARAAYEKATEQIVMSITPIKR